MPTISLCMIAREEEEGLARTLDCVRGIADEIVIVEAGATERTREIAKEYTDKIYGFEWTDDFSAARNFSFAQATGDYILWLDAGDVIMEEDRQKFARFKGELNPDVDVVMMRYTVNPDDCGEPAFFYYRERLVKRSCGFVWKEPVHEYLEIGGNILTSDIGIVHKNAYKNGSCQNISIYQSWIAKGGELSPRGLYYYARELKEQGRTDEAVEKLSIFLNMGEGWAEDNISACYELADCYNAQNNADQALISLLRSFLYDLPRAEACCRIGFIHLKKHEYKSAVFWFNLAAEAPSSPGWGIARPDYSDYIPYMELAVCYDRLGDPAQAEACNDKAGEIKPDAPEYLYNKKYFTALKNKQCAGRPLAKTEGTYGMANL